MNSLRYLSLFSGLVALGLGGLVLTRSRQAALNWVFGLGMGTLALVGFAHFALTGSLSPGSWDLWMRVRWTGEIAQPFFWLLFGALLLRKNGRVFSPGWLALLLGMGGGTLLFGTAAWWTWLALPDPALDALRLTPWGYYAQLFELLGAMAVLLILENAYRSSDREGRRRIKYLVLGLGGFFAFVIYQASQNLLFMVDHFQAFSARDLVLLMACTLMAFSLARHRLMGVKVYVSRYVIYNSLTVMAVGAYLLLIGGVGWLIRQYDGRFHTVLLETFLFLALVTMMVALLSEQIRQRVKVFINKHFYRSKYDYRVQWLAFTQRLSGKTTVPEMARAILEGAVEILGVRNGTLWLRSEQNASYELVGALGKRVPNGGPGPTPGIVRFLKETGWVFNVKDPKGGPDHLAILGEVRPFLSATEAELVVSIMAGERLLGILTLGESLGHNTYNYEDYDLLKTIAKQAAVSLMHARLSESSAAAREAEAFRRTASFVIHDLKNQASMLSLVLQNAAEHMQNPAFQQDLMRTLGRTVEKMQGLMARLQGPGKDLELKPEPGDLAEFIRQVLDDGRLRGLRDRLAVEDALHLPVRGLTASALAQAGTQTGAGPVSVDRQQMSTVLVNLLFNAVEASPPDALIRIRTYAENSWMAFEVKDRGCGMSRDFIEQSLFKPFQTTKPKGLGIGLYQCKAIVEAHGGIIQVKSKEGQGTTVTVKLPALQDEDSAGLGMAATLREAVR